MTAPEVIKKKRGFATMSETDHFIACRKGGIQAHKKGTAHQWTSEEAREMGRKGGTKISQNREWMQELGRRGGAALRRKKEAQRAAS